MRRIVAVVFAVLVTTGALSAADKKLMHCFLFTPIENATKTDWDAFYKATDQLPSKIPGLGHVWTGKLRRPFSTANGTRQYGVCMEFNDEAALKTYADHAAHKEWQAVYEKVRQPGTTTFDLVGQ